MTRLEAIFTLVVVGWSSAGRADNWVLPIDAEPPFTRVMHEVEAGQLGPDLKDAMIHLNGTVVEVELVSRSGGGISFRLKRRESVASSPDGGATRGRESRYFEVQEASSAPPEVVQRFEGLLDDAFQANPWVAPLDFTESPDTTGSRPIFSSWRREGFIGLMVAILGRRFITRVGLGGLIGVLLFVGAAVAVSLVLIGRARPAPPS